MKIVPDDYSKARWWFQIFVVFSPLFGKDFQFDEHIFQMGWFNQAHGELAAFRAEALSHPTKV